MADESLRNYGLAAPHGPNMGGEHVATQNIHHMNPNEKAIFDSLLLPDDSYQNGVYWADMSIFNRMKFTRTVDNAEAKKELTTLGRMIKKDPLSPISFYARNMILPGAGLLLEGYVLFSIGNVKSLFGHAFPTCWGKPSAMHPGYGKACNSNWRAAVDYLEIVGIMLGQVLVGILGDWLGRRWGLIQDAVIMFVGLLMLTSMWGTTLEGWVICYAFSLLFYSIGVGGEYPMTATSGMENAVGSGKVSTKEDRLHRGRKVTSAFLMQGWGQFFNQVILILCLLIFHGSGNPPYTELSTQYVFRVSFAIPAAGTLWLVYYRAYKMKYASKQLDMAKKKAHVTGYDTKSLKLTITYFGSRLIGTAGTWFCNDVFFYGNKLFQSTFIAAIDPSSSSNVMAGWLWNLVNIGVSLCGYYLASFLIDNKMYGRKTMMLVGFMLDFILLLVSASHFKYYSTVAVHSFQAMYFLASFFNQFGPNSVTFVVAAESYPTPIRATAHGFSAMVGKAGALLAAVLYNYLEIEAIFWFAPWWGLLGMLLTIFFVADTTGLDLKEQERRWNFIRLGREQDYHGIAIHPKHLSLWERFRGVGKHYNPQADYEQKLTEYRGDWERWQARKAAEPHGADEELDDSEYSDDVSSYFHRTAPNSIRHEKTGHAAQSDSSSNEKVM